MFGAIGRTQLAQIALSLDNEGFESAQESAKPPEGKQYQGELGDQNEWCRHRGRGGANSLHQTVHLESYWLHHATNWIDRGDERSDTFQSDTTTAERDRSAHQQ